MSEILFNAAYAGDLERVTLLVEQGMDKNQIGGDYGNTALSVAADKDHFAVVQYLVEQGADMDKGNTRGAGLNALHYACINGNAGIARYLLEQGADRDKCDIIAMTPLHLAASHGYLEIATLLMSYGADLNARNDEDQMPIDIAADEEIEQAIREEPRRRMDEAPGKRATEQDRHPNAATSASAQQDDDDDDDDEEDEEKEEEPSSKRPRLNEGEAEETNVAEEDEDSEPSSDGEDD